MENYNLLLGILTGGLIAPFVQWLRGRFVDIPGFVLFGISNGLAIASGFALNVLFKTGLEPNAVIMMSLAVIGTSAQATHAMSKNTKVMIKLKNGKK